MTAVQTVEYHADNSSLTWNLWWGIYELLSNWLHSQSSVTAGEEPSLKIPSLGASSKW